MLLHRKQPALQGVLAARRGLDERLADCLFAEVKPQYGDAPLLPKGEITGIAYRTSGSYRLTMFKTAVRMLAWIVLLAIFAATVSSIADRPHLTSGPTGERALAFFLLGLFFCLGYRTRWSVSVLVVLFAACGFEAAQLLTPDRHAEVADAFLKIAGGIAGVAIGLLSRANAS